MSKPQMVRKDWADREIERLTAERDEALKVLAVEGDDAGDLIASCRFVVKGLEHLAEKRDAAEERAEQAEARVQALEGALHAAIGIARHQARQGSVSVFNRVHPLTCGLNSQHAHLIPHWDGERLTLACIDCGYRQDYRAALSAPGQPEGGESQPLPPNPTCPECHGTGDAPNAQFRCPCRWRHLSKAAGGGQ
jgi:hypothetical protein